MNGTGSFSWVMDGCALQIVTHGYQVQFNTYLIYFFCFNKTVIFYKEPLYKFAQTVSM